jgi:hypothetical protein
MGPPTSENSLSRGFLMRFGRNDAATSCQPSNQYDFAGHVHVGQGKKYPPLMFILGDASTPSFAMTELIFDDMKEMLNLGPDAGFEFFDVTGELLLFAFGRVY